jgi:hypothetical protein
MAYCLSGDTLVYSEPATGEEERRAKRTLRSIYEMTQTPHGRSRLRLLRCARSTRPRGRYGSDGARRRMLGTKPVFRVELEDGQEHHRTKEHRFLTPNDGLEAAGRDRRAVWKFRRRARRVWARRRLAAGQRCARVP